MNKYEKLIEYIINDQEAKARELFHTIVVEKSRDIYESLMDESVDQYDQAEDFGADLSADVDSDETGDFTDETGEEEGEFADEEGEDEFGDEEGEDEFGGEDEGDLTAKFQDVRDIIDDLEAKFSDINGDDTGAEGEFADEEGEDEFGGEEGEDEFGDEEGGEAFVGADEMDASDTAPMESANPFAKKSGSGKSGSGKAASGKSGSGKSGSGKAASGKSGSGKSAAEMMREYVEKISAPSNTEFSPIGTGYGGDKAAGNTKGIVAGKNDMGGTTANIARGSNSESNVDGDAPKGKASGFVKSAKEIDVASRNVNKVGGNKGAEDFYKTKAKAKSAEGSTTSGSVTVNKSSLNGGQ